MSPTMKLEAAELFETVSPAEAELNAIKHGSLPVRPECSSPTTLLVNTMEEPEGFFAQTVAVAYPVIEAAEIQDLMATRQRGQSPPH